MHKTFSSIRWQTIIIYFTIFIIVFTGVAVTVSNVVTDFLIQERTQSQSNFNDEIAILTAPYVLNNDAKLMYDTCVEATKTNGGRLIITNKDQVVIADSFSLLNGNKIQYDELSKIVETGVEKAHGFYTIKQDGQDVQTVNYSSGIYSNGELIGISLYVASFNDIRDKIFYIYMNIGIIAFIGIIFVFILCLVSSSYITKPLNSFSTAIHNISNGNFNNYIEVKGKSEFAQLATTFNMMSKKLENTDRLRNEFVSNASHELRTPLSSMKILIQNMIFQDEIMTNEIRQEFLTDIDKEIDRLNSIIEDLLVLVQANNSKKAVKHEAIDMDDLLTHVTQRLKPLADKKAIQLHLDVEPDLILFGDTIKLQIAFSNLIDNAIKYNEENGNVWINAIKEENNVIVSIKDDGIGIPESDLLNIYDRFYRVDKARSRSTGGTGLGLSLTQRIIHLHDGTISTKSKLNIGTEFNITLPIVK